MIIREGMTSSGVRYKIDDSLLARGIEQKHAIAEAQRKAAYEILVSYAERKEKNHEGGTCYQAG